MSWVAVLMGSESDWPVMQSTTSMLKTLGVQYEVKVTSAHRTPAGTQAYVTDAEERGCRVAGRFKSESKRLTCGFVVVNDEDSGLVRTH